MMKATDVRANWKEVLDTVVKEGSVDFVRGGVTFTIVKDYYEIRGGTWTSPDNLPPEKKLRGADAPDEPQYVNEESQL